MAAAWPEPGAILSSFANPLFRGSLIMVVTIGALLLVCETMLKKWRFALLFQPLIGTTLWYLGVLSSDGAVALDTVTLVAAVIVIQTSL